MITLSVHEFKNILPPGRLIGFDLGTKTLGISISDTTRMIASAHSLIIKEKQAATFSKIDKIIQELFVVGCIIGLPLNLDGSQGPRCQAVQQFATDFEKFSNLPFLLWDERFSSNIVDKLMIQADMSRKKRSQNIDKMAATYILQGALDACK
jgi:putative Holliday junction resolvase